MKEILHLVFCKPSGISLLTHLLSSLHLLYLSLNSEIYFGRKEFECLAVLVLSVLNLPLRSICLQSYSLYIGCVGSFMISNILSSYVVGTIYLGRPVFLPTIPPAFLTILSSLVLVLFLYVTSPTDEVKA